MLFGLDFDALYERVPTSVFESAAKRVFEEVESPGEVAPQDVAFDFEHVERGGPHVVVAQEWPLLSDLWQEAVYDRRQEARIPVPRAAQGMLS